MNILVNKWSPPRGLSWSPRGRRIMELKELRANLPARKAMFTKAINQEARGG